MPVTDLGEEIPLKKINNIEIKTAHFEEILKKKEIVSSFPECNLRNRKNEEKPYCSRCGTKL